MSTVDWSQAPENAKAYYASGDTRFACLWVICEIAGGGFYQVSMAAPDFGLARSIVTRPTPIAEGWVLVPERLTAENGAKSLLMGEFCVDQTIDCPQCEGSGEGEDEDDCVVNCPDCDGTGCITVRHPVPWTTIKDMHVMMVEHFRANKPVSEQKP